MARIRTDPGEVLREEFMKPLNLSASALSSALRVPATRIGDILRTEKPRARSRPIPLSASAGISACRREFWLNLQSAYDLSLVITEHGPAIEGNVQGDAALAARGNPAVARRFEGQCA
jgi:addiction module HigA family antidote